MQPRTGILPLCRTLTVCEVCVYLCVWVVPCRSAALQWEAKLCCGSEAPCLPLPPMHVMWPSTQGNKTLPLPSTPSPSPSKKKTFQPVCTKRDLCICQQQSLNIVWEGKINWPNKEKLDDCVIVNKLETVRVYTEVDCSLWASWMSIS